MKALVLAAALLTTPALAHAGTVEVRLTGAQPGGPVMVQLCTSTERAMRGCTLRTRVTTANGAAVARFENVPAGTYAAGAFQDVDSNGRMGFGMMGRPTEPWGYSRDAKGVFGPPNFTDAAVAVPAAGAVVPVHLGL